MKKYRVGALILAVMLSASCYGCSIKDLLGESSEEASESESESVTEETETDNSDTAEKYSYVSIDEVKEHIAQLEGHTEETGNATLIEDDIQLLLDDMDSISEALSYIIIDYYLDWDNEKLEEMYDNCYEDYYVTAELLTYAFSNAYTVDEYKTLLEPYVQEDYVEYYTDRSLSIKRLEGYARVDYELMDESLDEYYDIVYNEDMSDDEKNLAVAEIYLDILSMYDTETFYDVYNRDFTPEQAVSLSNSVQEYFIPAGNAIEDAFYDVPHSEDIYDDPVLFDNCFDTIRDYASKLSPSIGKYASKLCDDKLYSTANGKDRYDGSFTVDLPMQNSALIYTYQYGDAYDMLTAIHEFGHFYSSFYDETPTYMQCNNIDIAEVQSQGMEMIFMQFYDEMYGEQSEAMKMYKLYDIVEAAISGFVIGEFEYQILRNIDTITPEEIVGQFDILMSANDYDTELYYISHLFEQPGYYISYGVSALAALDIWLTSLDDEEKAVEMYENIAGIACNSDEYQFVSALEEAGFANVLDDRYIKILAEKIEEYAKQ